MAGDVDVAPVVVVANPSAGRGKGGRLIGKVDRLLNAAGVRHEFRITESADDLKRQARSAADARAEVVAVLGGDGSIGLAADSLLGTETALAILPSGTADDFAKAVGVGRLQTAVRALAERHVERIDVVRVTTGAERRHFVNIAGAGFDSDVNEAANAMRIDLGATGTYIAAVVKTLSRFRPVVFRIDVDGESIEGAYMLVVVGNGMSYGGGMRVTPEASVVDGLLDVLLLGAMTKASFLRAFPKVFRGTHVGHPAVRTLRARSLRVESDRRVQVYADGERVGPLPAIFEVVPSALPLVVGPNAKAV
jgi:diacylglycerol kinase (ATP)